MSPVAARGLWAQLACTCPGPRPPAPERPPVWAAPGRAGAARSSVWLPQTNGIFKVSGVFEGWGPFPQPSPARPCPSRLVRPWWRLSSCRAGVTVGGGLQVRRGRCALRGAGRGSTWERGRRAAWEPRSRAGGAGAAGGLRPHSGLLRPAAAPRGSVHGTLRVSGCRGCGEHRSGQRSLQGAAAFPHHAGPSALVKAENEGRNGEERTARGG